MPRIIIRRTHGCTSRDRVSRAIRLRQATGNVSLACRYHRTPFHCKQDGNPVDWLYETCVSSLTPRVSIAIAMLLHIL